VPVNPTTALLSPASFQTPSASQHQPSILNCRLFPFLPPPCQYVWPAQLDSLQLVDTWMNMEWGGSLQSDYIVGVIIIIGLLELPQPHGSLILRPSTAHYQTDISHPPQWPYMSNTNKERYGDGIYQRDSLSANLEHRVTHTQQKISPQIWSILFVLCGCGTWDWGVWKANCCVEYQRVGNTGCHWYSIGTLFELMPENCVYGARVWLSSENSEPRTTMITASQDVYGSKAHIPFSGNAK